MDEIKKFEPLWGVWRTEALIGEGSYGKVYRAVREEFGRKYYAAIKHISIPSSDSQITEVISEGIASDKSSLKEYFESTAQNLINEIMLMNSVKGKTNIVSYEDHLVLPKPSGIGYDIIIRMELLTGLNDILRCKQLTNKDVIRLGIDLCSALEVCVEKGIVHRDIKPSNIFVSDSGDYKLGDFGVARELEYTTAAMSKKGTYVYMAPEVYRGESANFSADIFSLGIVMYRLLNGNRAPFLPVSAKMQPRDNEIALVRRMSGEQMPAPAFADEKLAKIILKATQFDRKKRYASPTEMKKDLMLLQEGKYELERTVPIIAEPTHDSAKSVVQNNPLTEYDDDNTQTLIGAVEQKNSKSSASGASVKRKRIRLVTALSILLLVVSFSLFVIFNHDDDITESPEPSENTRSTVSVTVPSLTQSTDTSFTSSSASSSSTTRTTSSKKKDRYNMNEVKSQVSSMASGKGIKSGSGDIREGEVGWNTANDNVNADVFCTLCDQFIYETVEKYRMQYARSKAEYNRAQDVYRQWQRAVDSGEKSYSEEEDLYYLRLIANLEADMRAISYKKDHLSYTLSINPIQGNGTYNDYNVSFVLYSPAYGIIVHIE